MDVLPIDLQLEIIQYLGAESLAQLCRWCMSMSRWSTRYLRSILVSRVQSTRLEVSAYDIGQLLHLCHVIHGRFRLSNGYCVTEQGQIYQWRGVDSFPVLIADPVMLVSESAHGLSILTRSGDVYIDGCYEKLTRFTLMTDRVNLRQVLNQSYLTHRGQVYLQRTRCVENLPKIVKIHDCMYSVESFFLTETGDVYYHDGGGSEGSIQLVEGVSNVVEISGYHLTTTLITRAGQVYVAGPGIFLGHLGRGRPRHN